MKSTYFWSFVLDGNEPMARRHPLPGQAHDKTCRPFLVPAIKANGIDLAEPWKYYYRNHAPEQANVQLGTLSKAWRGMKNLGLTLTMRKREWKDMLVGYARSAKRRRQRQAATKVVLVKRREESSSSSSDSSSS